MIPADTISLIQRIISHASLDYYTERNEALKKYQFTMARKYLIQSSVYLSGGADIYKELFAKFVRNSWASIERTLEEIGFEPDENAAKDLYALFHAAITPIMQQDNGNFERLFATTDSPRPQLHANRNAQLFRVETQITIFVKKLRAMKTNPKTQPGNQINYYLQGDNSRVNINSQDQSHNVVINEGQLFTKLHEAISSADVEADLKRQLLEKIDEGKALQKQPGLLKGWFADFMALASSCITVVQPFVPALAALIAKH